MWSHLAVIVRNEVIASNLVFFVSRRLFYGQDISSLDGHITKKLKLMCLLEHRSSQTHLVQILYSVVSIALITFYYLTLFLCLFDNYKLA